jgi:hypothetical protein
MAICVIVSIVLASRDRGAVAQALLGKSQKSSYMTYRVLLLALRLKPC